MPNPAPFTLPRESGTSIPEWVLDALPTLSNASDIKVLMHLAKRARYRRSGFGPGEISDAAGLDYRTTTASLARLSTLGYIVSAEGVHALRGACTTVAQALRKSTPTQQVRTAAQDAKNENLNNDKDLEGLRRTPRTQEQTPPTPQGGEARDSTAPGGEVPALAAVAGQISSPDGEAAEAAHPDLPPGVQVTPQRPARREPKAAGTEKVPPARRAATPTAHQDLYAAVALACYGGHEDLTDLTRSRVGKVAKSLHGAKFTAADVPQIVTWLRTTQSWRDAITPSAIEDQAPVWRGEQRGSLPARSDRPHIVKFSPRPQTTEDANHQAAQRASDLYAALQEDRHVVF